MEQLTQQTALQRFKHHYSVNKPKYLQGAGYFGLGVTLISGIYLGYKLPKAIDKAKAEINEDDKKYKKILKYLKHIAPCAAPAIVATTGTVMAFHGASKEQNRRLAVVGAAYTATLTELKAMKKKVEEVGGKKVAEKVKNAMHAEELSKVEDPEAKAKLEEQRNTPPDAVKRFENPYWDASLQTIHWSSKERLVDIEYKMLKKLEADGVVDLTTFYEEMGYGRMNKPIPEWAADYGWTVETVADLDWLKSQMPNAFFDVEGTTAETHDGIPCMYLEFFDKKILWDPLMQNRRCRS